MAVYNWRDGSCKRPGRCFDAVTGEEISHVFFWDEDAGTIGRFAMVGNRFMLTTTYRTVEIWETRAVRVEWKDEADRPHIVEAN